METINAVSGRDVVPKRVFTVVGACTGSLQEHVIFKALEAACPGIKFEALWSCEKNKDKQKWIRDLQRKQLPPPASGVDKQQLPSAASGVGIETHQLPSPASGVGTEKQQDQQAHETCIFEDICELHKGYAFCVVHEKRCPVTRGDIAIICGSCKDISRQNPNKKKIGKKSDVFQQEVTPGGSAQTYHGMLNFLELFPPAVLA